jgi:predicted nucleic acid-binding protein
MSASQRRLLVDSNIPMLAAERLIMTTDALSARDAIHVAVMQRHSIDEVMSFDAGFDHIPGLRLIF